MNGYQRILLATLLASIGYAEDKATDIALDCSAFMEHGMAFCEAFDTACEVAEAEPVIVEAFAA